MRLTRLNRMVRYAIYLFDLRKILLLVVLAWNQSIAFSMCATQCLPDIFVLGWSSTEPSCHTHVWVLINKVLGG